MPFRGECRGRLHPHTRARHSHSHVSLIVAASFLPSSIFHRRSVASSSVLVCACRSVALVLSGAVGVVTRLGTHAWLQRGIAAGARARAQLHAAALLLLHETKK